MAPVTLTGRPWEVKAGRSLISGNCLGVGLVTNFIGCTLLFFAGAWLLFGTVALSGALLLWDLFGELWLEKEGSNLGYKKCPERTLRSFRAGCFDFSPAVPPALENVE